MHVRFALIIAGAALGSASAYAAEPAKAPAKEATQPQQHPAPVVLASADSVHTPTATDQQSPAPAKRRFARVTTCRCGDTPPEPQPE